eukprot:CAMPEP_0184701886 /NCGR_PEP_ID=MMETSP0313-20130426/22028_1 /TAXON_ID=2792 /ORGANISM="Porphyridium aerugineum, Strain SAG 1380-2" /LENGTH=139 /DNA_ID=CAMNT_0027162143 /DNA_START=231 /DNA_END=651 /DNA_ORIENTATION=+
MHVALNRIDVLLIFFDGIRIVESQIGLSVEEASDSEIEQYGFRVAEMEVSVGFRWEPCHDGGVLAALEVIFDNSLEKLARMVVSDAGDGAESVAACALDLFALGAVAGDAFIRTCARAVLDVEICTHLFRSAVVVDILG